MRRNHYSAIALAETCEQFYHLVRGFDIHVRKRFVEQKKFRNGQEYAGERCALAHALGVLAQSPGESWIEADLTQSFGWVEALAVGIKSGEVAEIFLSGEFVIQHGRMTHVADAGTRIMRRFSAKDLDSAMSGLDQTCEHAEKGGLAGSVLADEDVALAGFEIDCDLTQCGKRSEKLGYVLKPGTVFRRSSGLRGLRVHLG
jgi:hypothetical protein